MPFVPTLESAKVTLRFNQNGQQTCNVFYVDVGVEPTETILIHIAEVFKLWWTSFMQSITNSATSLQAIEVVDASEVGEEGIVYTTGLPVAGTKVDTPMPNNVTVATKLLTGFTGRSRRGRKYFAGLSDTDNTGNGQVITSALQTALQTAYSELLIALTAEGWQWIIASFFSGGLQRLEALKTPIISVATELTLDSMRRRLPGRGT